VGLLGFILVPTLRADAWNEQTKVTFSAPIEVPGTALQAGTYIFKLLGSETDRNIVEIYNADGTQLEATVLAVPDKRLQATGKTVMEFAERPANSPMALEAWFYPGDIYGQEFVYPYSWAKELAKANKQPVFSTRADLSPYLKEEMKSDQNTDAKKMKSATVKVVLPNGQETNVPQPATPQP
jgi:ribosomal protein L9